MCLFWPQPGFYGREILERRLSAVVPSRTTAAYCPESIISSFCRRWFSDFLVGPCTLIRCHWKIFDWSHVPVTVDAARVPETLWNDCTVALIGQELGGAPRTVPRAQATSLRNIDVHPKSSRAVHRMH